MRLYTVHTRRPAVDPVSDVVLIRDGFCWPAALFTVFWALWHRLWLVAAGLVALNLATGAALVVLGAGEIAQGAIGVALFAAIGLFANDLRRWSLERRGWRFDGIVGGDDIEAAERRFLDARPDIMAGMGA